MSMLRLSKWIIQRLNTNLIPLAFLALLTGCATSARVLAPSTTNTASTAANSVSYQGRFAVRYEDAEKGTQNVYGHFVWHEAGANIVLQLLNPLGQILAVLEVTPSEARLRLPRRTPQTATNIEDLMQQVLGFALPINNLRTWLRPLQSTLSTSPRASSKSNALKKVNLSTTQFKQDGWTIDYIATNDKEGTSLTHIRRINLKRDEPPTDVKLVIDP